MHSHPHKIKSTMNTLNILIADDHEIMRDGILATLRDEGIVNQIYQAADGQEALSKCRAHSDINIILMDINMPDIDGITLTETIKDQYPDIDIIALSMLKDEQSIRKMLKAGASGYVLKSSGKVDLVQAIKNISEGEPFYSDEVTFQVMKGLHSGRPGEPTDPADNDTQLTDREIEVLQLIVEEHTNQEIADMLYISKRTVDSHRSNLLQKTNSKNTAGLVRFALKHNLG